MLTENIDRFVPTQLSLHAIPTSGPLEELEKALEGSEDVWYI